MEKNHPTNCLNCKSENLYGNITRANGLFGPSLLPRLGPFGNNASMHIFVCEDCGHIQFFADKRSRSKLAPKWARAWLPFRTT